MALLETLLLVSAGTKALGQVIGGIGDRRAASASEREGSRLADDAIARGERDVELYGMDLSRLLGSQRVASAAQGIDPDFGSAATIARQTERFGAEDIETIRENAMREANALRRGGRNQARQLRMQATGQFLGAAGNVLNLGANAWDLWSRGRNPLSPSQTRTVTADPAWF